MKQHIAVFTLGLSLLTSCMTDSAYRKVENGFGRRYPFRTGEGC